jgi:5-methylcytosine-specific restriction endonuclease McrA
MKTNNKTKLWEWQQRAKNAGHCEECNNFKKALTVDHIIPVSILDQLGLFDEKVNWEENFRLVCEYCNRFKGGRLDIRNPKTLVLLNEIIRLLTNYK